MIQIVSGQRVAQIYGALMLDFHFLNCFPFGDDADCGGGLGYNGAVPVVEHTTLDQRRTGTFGHGFLVNQAQGDFVRWLVAVSLSKFPAQFLHDFECNMVIYMFAFALGTELFIRTGGLDGTVRTGTGVAFGVVETWFAIEIALIGRVAEAVAFGGGYHTFARCAFEGGWNTFFRAVEHGSESHETPRFFIAGVAAGRIS